MNKRVYVAIAVIALAALACEFSFSTSPQTGGQSGNVLFRDDFSNPASGWPVESSGNIRDYAGGGYRIYVSETWSDVIATPGRSLPADVIIDVDAARNSGTDNNDFGVLCRVQNPDNFYFFQISSDGYAVIGKFVNNEMQYISSDGMEKVDGIHASAVNHIRAECIGNSFKLYANGRLVAQATDNTFSSGGDVGLMAGTFDQGGVDILFDNFVVTRP